jgi:hypothetical protein
MGRKGGAHDGRHGVVVKEQNVCQSFLCIDSVCEAAGAEV